MKMISKITFTPQSFIMQNNNFCGPKKGLLNSFEKGDTVSFGNAKALDTLKKGVRVKNPLVHIVSNMFEKLSTTRTSNDLGTYMATTKNADVYLRETKLGKKAQLTLSNGVFGDKSYMNFIIERESGKVPKITSSDETVSSKEAAKIVQTYLQDFE